MVQEYLAVTVRWSEIETGDAGHLLLDELGNDLTELLDVGMGVFPAERNVDVHSPLPRCLAETRHARLVEHLPQRHGHINDVPEMDGLWIEVDHEVVGPVEGVHPGV